MASTTATATQNRPGGNNRGRGKGGNRGGRGGNRGRGGSHIRQPQSSGQEENVKLELTSPTVEETPAAAVNGAATTQTEEEADEAVCWICAEPVKYYSISQCNHRTCHVCALRLRALYKKLDCTFCKEPQQTVIFTVSPDALWESFTPDAIPYKDPKLSIGFETQEMMEDSLILLRFNCPDSSCDYIANGWSDLKLHTRASHGKVMCDLCIRSKKIFAHEHILYHPSQLPNHLPSLLRNSHRAPPKEQPEGGVHPLCEFCRECFFGDDELYAHMREKHEECFICKRNEVKDQYFRNYDALEQHFHQGHHPCTQSVCLARKFVVFGSALDLKAHMVEEHGADMTSRDKKDARRIQAEFEFEEVGVGGRRGGRRDRGDREREREPPPHLQQPTPTTASSSRTAGAGGRRREAFSGNLSTPEGGGTPNASGSRLPSRGQSPAPPENVDPAVAERHSAFLARVSSLAPNPNAAVPAVKAAVRSYRANESAARDLISTTWNVLDRNLEGTASIVNALVDLLDDEDKKKTLLEAWNGFKIEQRNQFPALAAIGAGTEWAGITGGRILHAKQSTTSHSSSQSSRQVQDRVARAAAASSSAHPPAPARPVDRFPALQSTTSVPGNSGFRQPQRNTPWAGSSSSPAPSAPPAPRVPVSVPGPGATSRVTGRGNQKTPTLSRAAFPELPTSSATKVPRAAVGGNQSLKNIVGDSTPTMPVWQAGGGTSGSGPSTPVMEGLPVEDAADAPSGGSKKKGKGKQKQMLFTLGSFPT
ncbi:hypothetical protein EIP91_004179 [Steccherinum ochraceum]|uniref:RING-type E3 ubiquitin transferase n=1 Tax=Steccherinum ochraceum TaxID=92696 RepID=A0A4R0S017_9APHY|nr:hypothetical protein EIP91_004179 [Steccherinum ochraceum]